jgi:hypothetical protein
LGFESAVPDEENVDQRIVDGVVVSVVHVTVLVVVVPPGQVFEDFFVIERCKSLFNKVSYNNIIDTVRKPLISGCLFDWIKLARNLEP